MSTIIIRLSTVWYEKPHTCQRKCCYRGCNSLLIVDEQRIEVKLHDLENVLLLLRVLHRAVRPLDDISGLRGAAANDHM